MSDPFAGMRKDSVLYKELSETGKEEARKRAALLQKMLDKDALVPRKQTPCRSCMPNRVYPAPQIDASLI